MTTITITQYEYLRRLYVVEQLVEQLRHEYTKAGHSNKKIDQKINKLLMKMDDDFKHKWEDRDK